MKLEAFFKPKSIAVIGASREPEKVGYRILRNVIDSGFTGSLYPVNPNATEILGFKCWQRISDVPDEVDLAIIVVPAKIVALVAEECGKKGVKGIVVISAGFSEVGREGTLLERDLVDICKRHNMRMQGPNCLGIISTQTCLNASFASANPSIGNIAFISQSGALGSTILNWALQNNVGFSSFVSLGNEADLNSADFLEALAEDEQTKCIGLYIEGVKEGQQFVESARSVTARKPVIALKAGTTDVGVRAVSSHTGSLAGSDTAFSAAFKKAGILRANTLEELFDLLLAFEAQPLPEGQRTLIITNGGGPGILVADACEKLDLDIPSLEYEIREDLRRVMPPHASVGNPVDVLGDADDVRYELALDAGIKSENIDGIIIIVTPQAMTPAERIAEVVARVCKSCRKPVISVFMGYDDESAPIKILREHKIPNYFFPDSAPYALRVMYDYNKIAKTRHDEPSNLGKTDDREIKEVLDQVRREDRLNVTIDESIRVARAYGIPTAKAAIAKTVAEAEELASSIGFPLAMKIISPDIVHKTDFGGVVLNVSSPTEVETNYDAMIRKARATLPEARISGILIQKMIPPGREVIIGTVRDLQFGPLIMFGLGGIYVNFLRDVSYRLCPVTRAETKEMIENTKAYALLRGVRGEAASDIESVIDVILRVSKIMERFTEIIEMEINPLFVFEEKKGSCAADIRITIK